MGTKSFGWIKGLLCICCLLCIPIGYGIAFGMSYAMNKGHNTGIICNPPGPRCRPDMIYYNASGYLVNPDGFWRYVVFFGGLLSMSTIGILLVCTGMACMYTFDEERKYKEKHTSLKML